MYRRKIGLFSITLLSSFFLLACGGGNAETEAGSTRLLATTTVPFSASLVAAPRENRNGEFSRIEVKGTNLGNVELLPEKGYLPRYGVFNISPDKTYAWLDLDMRILPKTPTKFRISAFDRPAGQAGAKEIVVMAPRQWINDIDPGDPAPFSAAVSVAPGDNVIVRGTIYLEIRGHNIVNAELVDASTNRILGTFTRSGDRTFALLKFDTRSVPDGVKHMKILAYNVAPGQPNAKVITAMPVRRWHFTNGSTPSFTATTTIAPLSYDLINGVMRLEVRGTGIKNAELLSGETGKYLLGRLNVSSDGTRAWLDLRTGQFLGELSGRIAVYNVPPGQPNAKEIIAMPMRTWHLDMNRW